MDEPPKFFTIDPDKGREVPGFFVITIDENPVWVNDDPRSAPVPHQFGSLRACHAFLRERFGLRTELPVVQHMRIEQDGPEDFPVCWAATICQKDSETAVMIAYVGSFRWRDGRRVDPLTLDFDKRH